MADLVYRYTRKNPQKVRKFLEQASIAQLPRDIPVNPHFTPRYKPWDQRLCVCPDGDFFAALRSTKASVVTHVIKQVTETEILLKSGQKLHADIIITATGLQPQFAGGIQIFVDGKVIDPSSKYIWKGCMLQDVPNLIFVVGYVNASWTLGAEATSALMTRLWRRMKAAGTEVAMPRLDEPENMKESLLLGLSSTYFLNVSKIFPKSGVG